MRIESLLEGFLALLYGVKQCCKSPNIKSTYKRFGKDFIMASVIGYVLLSATMVLFLPVLLLVLAGPILGTILLVMITSIVSVVSCFLLFIGKFPSHLLMNSTRRPFVNLPNLSFHIASMLIPYSMDEFVLEGIDAIFPEIGTEKTRSSYEKPTKSRGVKLCLFGISQDFFFKVVSIVMTRFIGRNIMTYSNPVIFSIYLGSQLASTYTLRIRRMGVREHINWCGDNALRIIGFTLPFAYLERWEFVSTFVFLGLGPAVSAALVQPLIYSDTCEREKSSDGFYKAKTH